MNIHVNKFVRNFPIFGGALRFFFRAEKKLKPYSMADVKIDVEYCGFCGHRKQFLEMAELIKDKVPTAKISGTEGRQASFEIRVNNELVYSKLQTMAFPNFSEVSDLAVEVCEGKPVRTINKQQPIDCTIA